MENCITHVLRITVVVEVAIDVFFSSTLVITGALWNDFFYV